MRPSPRPARPTRPRRHPCEERRRDPEPHPGQAHRRGALRGAQAEPRRGVQEDRPADQRPRLPQGQGARPAHRPAGRPGRRPRRGHQRGAAPALRPGAAGERARSRWRSPRSTSPSSRTTTPSSSPPRSTSGPRSRCRRFDGLEVTVDDIAVTDEDVEEQVQSLRERFGTLLDVERAAADGDFVTIDLKATKDGEVVEGGEASGVSYQIGRGGMLDGLDEALLGMSAGETTTFTLHARRRRPRG